MSTSMDDIVVLHVDDDREFAELTATYLERGNDRFSVDMVDSAVAGLERLDRADYDCIVSDYDMPNQNGIEFLRTVRTEHDSIPFILFTGKGSEDVASDAIAAGVTDYLQKGGGSEVYSLLRNRIRNVVDQYRLKRAQQETKERYQTLVDDSPNPIAVHRDGIVFANEAMVELLGAEDVAEIEGIHPTEVVHPEYQEVFGDRIERVQDGGTVNGQEVLVNRLDGETRHVEIFGNRVQYGGKSAIQIVVQDITERVERQRQLRHMKRAVDAAAHAIYVTDVEGEIQYVNPAFEEITGYGRDEAIGSNPAILNSGEMPDGYFDDLWDTVLSGASWEEVVVNRRKDGSLYRALQSIAPVEDEAGQIEAFVAIQKETPEDDLQGDGVG